MSDIIELYQLGQRGFTNAELGELDLSGVTLSGCDLSNADLHEANLAGADLSHSVLAGANMEGLILTGANLSNAFIADANLREAKLTAANLEDACLSHSNLIEANLSGANLQGALLDDANLLDANLLDANLKGADLSLANLAGANLAGTDLSQCRLFHVVMSDTHLGNAILPFRYAMATLHKRILNAIAAGAADPTDYAGLIVEVGGHRAKSLAVDYGNSAVAAFILVESCPSLGGFVPSLEKRDEQTLLRLVLEMSNRGE